MNQLLFAPQKSALDSLVPALDEGLAAGFLHLRVEGLVDGPVGTDILKALPIANGETRKIGDLLQPGQNVLVDRMHYRIASIEPGDVIVFYPGGNEDAHPFVKRVAAGPGQTVQITDGTLLIDGVPAPGAENYDKIEDPGLAKNPVTLGEDEYFVLGDNRNNSEDSRSAGIGNVSGGDVIGRAWLSLPAGQAGVSRIH